MLQNVLYNAQATTLIDEEDGTSQGRSVDPRPESLQIFSSSPVIPKKSRGLAGLKNQHAAIDIMGADNMSEEANHYLSNMAQQQQHHDYMTFQKPPVEVGLKAYNSNEPMFKDESVDRSIRNIGGSIDLTQREFLSQNNDAIRISTVHQAA